MLKSEYMMLDKEGLQAVAKAAYIKIYSDSELAPKWDGLAPSTRKQWRDAMAVALTTAFEQSNNLRMQMEKSGEKSSDEQSKGNPSSATTSSLEEFLKNFLGFEVKGREEEDDYEIVEYIAHHVQPDRIPSEKTYQKVGAFLNHLRDIATIQIKGKDYAKSSNDKSGSGSEKKRSGSEGPFKSFGEVLSEAIARSKKRDEERAQIRKSASGKSHGEEGDCAVCGEAHEDPVTAKELEEAVKARSGKTH